MSNTLPSTAAPGAETAKEYVVRRAGEVKQYQRVADSTGVGYHWLTKLAQGRIPKPNYDDIETLWRFYRALEVNAGAWPDGDAWRGDVRLEQLVAQ